MQLYFSSARSVAQPLLAEHACVQELYNLVQNWTAVVTTTAVASSLNPSTYGQSVTFTATNVLRANWV
jgi:hypothetical protein